MTSDDVSQLFVLARVALVSLGFLAGLKLGQGFSFWKW